MSPAAANVGVVRFALTDLDLFSAASRDRNPLHLDAGYARRTPYGERVVFGVLGALASLGRLRPRPGQVLASLLVEFPSPMLVGVDYRLEASEPAEDRVAFKLFDGKRLVLRASAVFAPGAPRPSPQTPPSPDEEATSLDDAALARGLRLEERYSPDWRAVATLRELLGLDERGVDPLRLAVLLGCSYLVGMRLPGRRALFSRLSLKLAEGEGTPLAYTAVVGGLDPRFSLLTFAADFHAAGAPLAHADVQAFVRQDAPIADAAAIDALLPRSSQMAGKVALVTGGSRGLGAAIARALALQGCTVLLSFLRSAVEAEAVRASVVGGSGKILLAPGDCADPTWCAELRRRALELGGIDVLVCNATPPLLPLWIEPESTSRINDYVARSLALCSAPLAALLDPVAGRAGWGVVISSGAVKAPVAEWPHYVSAKAALEGLTRVAALEHPGASLLIVRPPRLLTDLTNTPLGRQNAMAPERVATAIVRRLLGPTAAGQVEMMEAFA
jgi:NAD(P)-dependent dehydrogenase (short-subunit alcohol dehydrogenase family)